MTLSNLRHVYGPVPSRRLGRSLGLDLVPYKICTYDCIYCQLGRTTHLTLEQDTYVPVDAILEECFQVLAKGDKPDVISLAGSGEPTLNRAIGDIIRAIKDRTAIPVAVLTNGALLWHPDVQAALLAADLVMPSLDAGDAAAFQRVNRPHPDLAYETMVDGLAAFTRRFAGKVWLEVLLVEGITGTREEVAKIAAQAERIQPDRIQLNTVCRPPAEVAARPLAPEDMRRLADIFKGPVDIIGRAVSGPASGMPGDESLQAAIRAMIARRPCTAPDVACGLGVHINEVLKHLEALTADRQLEKVVRDQQTYFIPPARKGRP